MLSPEVWIIHLLRKVMWAHILIIHPNLSFFAALFSHYTVYIYANAIVVIVPEEPLYLRAPDST